MANHVLALPPELRVAIYEMIIPSEIILPNSLPAGVAALLMTSKQTRSEVLWHLWGMSAITWQGTLTSKRWEAFRKIGVPNIRRLTIIVNADPMNSYGVDNVMHQLLRWMSRRSKPGMRARYPWTLQELTLRDRPRAVGQPLQTWSTTARCWICARDWQLSHGWQRTWRPSGYEGHLVEKLRSCGVEVTVEAAWKVFQ